jgi:hypothetical protein
VEIKLKETREIVITNSVKLCSWGASVNVREDFRVGLVAQRLKLSERQNQWEAVVGKFCDVEWLSVKHCFT